jgi:hypothetical protein
VEEVEESWGYLMRRRNVLAALVVAALVVLVPVAAQGANGHANYQAVCPGSVAGSAHCHVLVVTDRRGNPRASSSPTGLSPATIKSVYGFDTSLTAGAGKTIAIVDAYDDPNAESDLNVFSAAMSLPPCTSTGSDPCFTKVDQTGGTNYPRTNSGWALEISLDVQWAHAIAPGAKILLVEASSNSFSDLLTAERYAADPNRGNADYVSNSWGGSEFSGETSYDGSFSQSGVSFFVSAGDAGLPAEYPSASPNVISVGGTTLHFSGGTFTSETGWSSGGGGCSSYETATSAQANFNGTGSDGYAQVNCNGKRATPDVSLDADPNSGVSVYDSVKYYGQTGWWTVGGTSASSPMWAARSADQGVAVNSAYVYGNSIPFRDITSGNNGAPCLPGFDLCTGRGSWADGGGGSGGGGGTTTTADFSLSVSPNNVVVKAGVPASYTVTVSGSGGFAGTVSLSVGGAPADATTVFNPASVTGSESATLTVTTSTRGNYTLTITGTDPTDSLTHTTSVSLKVH